MGVTRALAALCALALLFAAGCAQQPAQPAPQLAGNESDPHGCVASAGYVWCEPLQKCYRPWEQNCTAGQDAMISQALAFCDQPDVKSASLCGSILKVTSALADGGTAFYFGSLKIICPSVLSASMSAQCKDLMAGDGCDEQKVC